MNATQSGILIAILTAASALLIPLLLKFARHIKTDESYLEMGLKRINLLQDDLYCLELYIKNNTRRDLFLHDLCIVNENKEKISELSSDPFLKAGEEESRIQKEKDGSFTLISISGSNLAALYSFKVQGSHQRLFLSYTDERGKRMYGSLQGKLYERGKIYFYRKNRSK